MKTPTIKTDPQNRKYIDLSEETGQAEIGDVDFLRLGNVGDLPVKILEECMAEALRQRTIEETAREQKLMGKPRFAMGLAASSILKLPGIISGEIQTKTIQLLAADRRCPEAVRGLIRAQAIFVSCVMDSDPDDTDGMTESGAREYIELQNLIDLSVRKRLRSENKT